MVDGVHAQLNEGPQDEKSSGFLFIFRLVGLRSREQTPVDARFGKRVLN